MSEPLRICNCPGDIYVPSMGLAPHRSNCPLTKPCAECGAPEYVSCYTDAGRAGTERGGHALVVRS